MCVCRLRMMPAWCSAKKRVLSINSKRSSGQFLSYGINTFDISYFGKGSSGPSASRFASVQGRAISSHFVKAISHHAICRRYSVHAVGLVKQFPARLRPPVYASLSTHRIYDDRARRGPQTQKSPRHRTLSPSMHIFTSSSC